MSTYDVAFWTVTGGVVGGVVAWAGETEVRKLLNENRAVLIAGGALAGMGTGVLIGSRFSVIGDAVEEIKNM